MRRAWVTLGIVLTLLFVPNALAQSPGGETLSSTAPVGTTTVFAQLPCPGHPYGVLVTDSAVYATTSSGAPFRESGGKDEVLAFSPAGDAQPNETVTVDTMPDMGLYGAAADAQGRIYVVNMNGEILRLTPTAHGHFAEDIYATNPYQALGWKVSMWMFDAFDAAGNLYVTDASEGAIWKIAPNGEPAIWFQDVRLRQPVQLAGLNGLDVSPDQRWLYFVLPGEPQNLSTSAIYRLPLTSTSPAPSDLQLFHEFTSHFDPATLPGAFPLDPFANHVPPPAADDLAFAASGNMYVTLSGAGAIAVLDRGGNEIRRIADPQFDWSLALRFQGDSLIVANSNTIPNGNDVPNGATGACPQDGYHAADSALLKVYVGEPALQLLSPKIPGGSHEPPRG